MSQHNAEIFELHPQLAADTFHVATLRLSELLLSNDCRYVWCILVPRLPNLRDFHDLPAEHKAVMHEEIDRVSEAIKGLTKAYKINVAALGNMVEQLHVHVIARHRDDAAWPGPVWGVGNTKPYPPDELDRLVTRLRKELL